MSKKNGWFSTLATAAATAVVSVVAVRAYDKYVARRGKEEEEGEGKSPPQDALPAYGMNPVQAPAYPQLPAPMPVVLTRAA